jgi:hypothetical protein
MALSRLLRCRIASIVALALLLTQLAIAAHACPNPGASAGHGSMAGMPCEQPTPAQPAVDPDPPALCSAHCQADAVQPQPDVTQPSIAFTAMLAPPFVHAQSGAVPAAAPHWHAHERERWRAPPTPHSIAHCCWRI